MNDEKYLEQPTPTQEALWNIGAGLEHLTGLVKEIEERPEIAVIRVLELSLFLRQTLRFYFDLADAADVSSYHYENVEKLREMSNE